MTNSNPLEDLKQEAKLGHAARYTGDNRYLQNTEGIAWYSPTQQCWCYRPDGARKLSQVYRNASFVALKV